MGNDAFGLSMIGQISMRAKDLARAEAFYRDTLGMKHLFTVSGMSFFDCGGIRLMLTEAEKPEFDHPGSIIYYKVADIQAGTDTLKARGVDFTGEPRMIADMGDHELWMAFFRDSEENLLAMMAEVMK